MNKIFIEYGLDFDNNKYGFGRSTEIEFPDGTEIRTKEKIKIDGGGGVISWYIRLWIFKHVFSIDGNGTTRHTKKNRNNLKIVFGRYGLIEK